MIACTCGGAEVGAIARPSGPSVAFSVAGAGAAWPGCAVPGRCSPASTARRSSALSERLMRPSTRRWDARSQERTREAVPRPYIPSTVVFRPHCVRKPCRTRTSVPRIPTCRVREPNTRRAASADVTGSTAALTVRATASVRQRDNTSPFFPSPAGLAVGLARKDALRRSPTAIRPRAVESLAHWVPRSPPADRRRLGYSSLEARHSTRAGGVTAPGLNRRPQFATTLRSGAMRLLRAPLVLATLAITAWLAPAAGAAPSLVKLGDFSAPVYVTGPPGDTSRVFVVEQGGKIQLLVNGVRQSTPFLDVSGILSSGEERGLLSMAFSPDYQTSGRFWIYVTVKAANATSGTEGEIQVREYRRADANHASPSPVKILLTARHDAADNHNGGQLQVGPDGMLWLGTGDGGGSDNDAVPGSSQDVTNPLGKIMRIDPNGNPFGDPAGNPFSGRRAAPIVWAYGLRNPWRCSFDRANGDLVIADGGQNEYEEVDWAPAPGRGRGANYGWPCREGAHSHNSCNPSPPTPVDPTLEKTHSGDGYCA